MKRFLLLVICLCTLAACDDLKAAQKALSNMGFVDIKTTGYTMFGCGKDDDFHTGFTATNPITGLRVTGVVCSGWLKGATVRFD